MSSFLKSEETFPTSIAQYQARFGSDFRHPIHLDDHGTVEQRQSLAEDKVSYEQLARRVRDGVVTIDEYKQYESLQLEIKGQVKRCYLFSWLDELDSRWNKRISEEEWALVDYLLAAKVDLSKCNCDWATDCINGEGLVFIKQCRPHKHEELLLRQLFRRLGSLSPLERITALQQSLNWLSYQEFEQRHRQLYRESEAQGKQWYEALPSMTIAELPLAGWSRPIPAGSLIPFLKSIASPYHRPPTAAAEGSYKDRRLRFLNQALIGAAYNRRTSTFQMLIKLGAEVQCLISEMSKMQSRLGRSYDWLEFKID